MFIFISINVHWTSFKLSSFMEKYFKVSMKEKTENTFICESGNKYG